MVSQSGGDTASFDVEFEGTRKVPRSGYWKTNKAGVDRLLKAERIVSEGRSIAYVRYLGDFPVYPISSFWSDTWGVQSRSDPKRYVVQTATQVIERCMLLTTDPGDLILDPTCGSGTTAYIAEQWGRRWITIDTSRVALAIARQRLLTAKYDFYSFRPLNADDLARNPHGTWLTDPAGELPGPSTFRCEAVPHTTLKSIAQNQNLDPIFAKHGPILDDRLKACNAALDEVNEALRAKLAGKLVTKAREQGKKSITDADARRWELPKKSATWENWQVPFDTDPHWPEGLQQAVTEYRKAWRAKMDEVNACIAANAEQEELVDRPEVVKGVVRVSGPFTVEAVQPPELSLGANIDLDTSGDGKFDGEPEALAEGFEPRTFRIVEPRADLEAKNLEAYLDQMLRLLRMDGVRFPNNQQMRFSRLDRVDGAVTGLVGEGRWVAEGQEDPDAQGRASVAVAIGPQYGPVTAQMVVETRAAAIRMGYADLVIAGFSFDGAAQAEIEGLKGMKIRSHLAHIRPDVNPGMQGLLKEQPGSQLFTVFGQPRTCLEGPDKDGQYTVTMEGVDIYNPVDNSIVPTGADKVAAWFLDSDYDGRTFCITQAFFPDKTAWERLAIARVLYEKISGERDDQIVTPEDVEEAISEDEAVTGNGAPSPARKSKRKTRTIYGHGARGLELFWNTPDQKRTIRIDSKLLAEAEGFARDKSRQEAGEELRRVVATVGKPGLPGEHVRCVVSVAMLTEGWDANNVTQILGIRAFGTQLLCEQVVGRGLRRMDYVPDPETGLLTEEYVDVYGIPFSVVPFKGRTQKQGPPEDRPKNHVRALPERALLEMRFPVVEGYAFALKKNLIRCDVEKMEGLELEPNREPTATFVLPTVGYREGAAAQLNTSLQMIVQNRDAYYREVHIQTIEFGIARAVLEQLTGDTQQVPNAKQRVLRLQSRHQLFPQIYGCVRQYVASKVNFKGCHPSELGLEKYVMRIVERLRDAIVPNEAEGEPPLLPILNRYKPIGTTAEVDFKTTRPCFGTQRSHINQVVADTVTWESSAAFYLERSKAVKFYARNDHLGLLIPYDYMGVSHNYEPDFLVRLADDTTLILEIKGLETDQDRAKHNAARRWVSAVNNWGQLGVWGFHVCREPQWLDKELSSLPYSATQTAT
jgi:hypothetical protein